MWSIDQLEKSYWEIKYCDHRMSTYGLKPSLLPYNLLHLCLLTLKTFSSLTTVWELWNPWHYQQTKLCDVTKFYTEGSSLEVGLKYEKMIYGSEKRLHSLGAQIEKFPLMWILSILFVSFMQGMLGKLIALGDCLVLIKMAWSIVRCTG